VSKKAKCNSSYSSETRGKPRRKRRGPFYYSAQILFFGAEFTQVYANRFGSHIEPAEDAVPVTKEARAEQGLPHDEDLKKAHQDRKAS